jgi:hypothetical protein
MSAFGAVHVATYREILLLDREVIVWAWGGWV